MNDGLLEMIRRDKQAISMLNKIVMKGTTVLWLYLLWKRRNGMEMPCLWWYDGAIELGNNSRFDPFG